MAKYEVKVLYPGCSRPVTLFIEGDNPKHVAKKVRQYGDDSFVPPLKPDANARIFSILPIK